MNIFKKKPLSNKEYEFDFVIYKKFLYILVTKPNFALLAKFLSNC